MAFNINNFLNAESKKEIRADWKPVKINIHKLRPAPEAANFYHADDKEIRELAESIELVGLQQYPVVRLIEGTDEYEVIAGHKRRLALLRLVEEGKTEYAMVPCKIETMDDIQNELVLIFTNSTQRERTDYEKMREIERVRTLLTEYQKTHKLTGRKQSIIAGILGTSKTKVGTLDKINSNLIAPFKNEFAAGKISTSTASEIAGLKPDAQQALHETYEQTGALTAREAKAAQESIPPEELPEETKPNRTEAVLPKETVSEHGRGQQEPPEPATERVIPPEASEKELSEIPEKELPGAPEKDPTETAVDPAKEYSRKCLARLHTKELESVCEYLEPDEINYVQELVARCCRRARRNAQTGGVL